MWRTRNTPQRSLALERGRATQRQAALRVQPTDELLRALLVTSVGGGRVDITVVTDDGRQATLRHRVRVHPGGATVVTASELVHALHATVVPSEDPIYSALLVASLSCFALSGCVPESDASAMTVPRAYWSPWCAAQ